MTSDQIKSLREEVTTTIERVVNGKIKNIDTKLDKHIDEMAPFIEFIRTLNSFNRFLKWGGVTFFAFIALIWLLIKRQ
jgi:hypothetical protein